MFLAVTVLLANILFFSFLTKSSLICLSFCPSTCHAPVNMSVCPSVCCLLSVQPSAYQFLSVHFLPISSTCHIYLSICPSVRPFIHPFVYPFTIHHSIHYPSFYQSILCPFIPLVCLSIYPPIYYFRPSKCPTAYPYIYSSVFLLIRFSSFHLSICKSAYVSSIQFICPSVYLSVHLSVYPSFCFHPSVCHPCFHPFICQSVYSSILSSLHVFEPV